MIDWTAIVERKQTLLLACYGALDALMLRGVQSYTVDTGQTRMVVQRTEVGSLRGLITTLEGELDTLSARLGDGAHAVTRPDNLRPYL